MYHEYKVVVGHCVWSAKPAYPDLLYSSSLWLRVPSHNSRDQQLKQQKSPFSHCPEGRKLSGGVVSSEACLYHTDADFPPVFSCACTTQQLCIFSFAPFKEIPVWCQMALFQTNQPFKGTVSNCSSILKYQRLQLQHMNFGPPLVQPVRVIKRPRPLLFYEKIAYKRIVPTYLPAILLPFCMAHHNPKLLKIICKPGSKLSKTSLHRITLLMYTERECQHQMFLVNKQYILVLIFIFKRMSY